MEYLNEFHKQWIERSRKPIVSWSKQLASLEEKKVTGTLEPTESYKRGQVENSWHRQRPILHRYSNPIKNSHRLIIPPKSVNNTKQLYI